MAEELVQQDLHDRFRQERQNRLLCMQKSLWTKKLLFFQKMVYTTIRNNMGKEE